jgi:hypothetical protein
LTNREYARQSSGNKPGQDNNWIVLQGTDKERKHLLM